MNSSPATALPPPEAAARPLTEARLVCYVVLGLLVAIVCAFAGVVRCDFIDLDDRSHVLENPLVRGGLTWVGVKEAFVTPHASLWVPLTWISFMADVSLFGLNPGAMHAVNLALHATAAVLLFLALKRMTGRLGESAVVAALFGLHPINVESVAWVTERKNVLCAVFWMLTLLAYARYAERPRAGRYLLVLAAFTFALFSKPLAVTLPCALLLLDFWPLQRHLRTPWLHLALEKLPLLAIAVFGAGMQMHAVELRGQSVALDLVPFAVRFSNAVTSYTVYLGDLAWPARLGVFYPHPLKFQTLAAALATTLLGGITFAAWRERAQRPYLLTGWCWFIGTLFPMIGFVQAGSQARADRFTYVAQIGLFVALVWLIRTLPRPRFWGLAAAAAFVACGVLTARQVTCWNDSIALFEHTLRVTRPNARVEALAGYAYARRGDYAAAIPRYQRALLLLPDVAETWNDFGAALTRLGRDADAAKAFAEALSREPDSAMPRYNLASALVRLGRRDEAIDHFRVVTAAMPDFGRAHYHLGRLLVEAGQRAEALDHLRTAVRLLPADLEVRGALAKVN
ncbi:MAG: tetratricopeptide repeat protein [Chthoniobacteraceae bacterium]